MARTNENYLVLAGTEAGTQKGPEDEVKALEYLQSIYRDPMEPTPVRMNAAKAALEYEQPRLSAVAVGHFNKTDFASMLERAIERSKASYVPRALPAPEQHPASEVKGNFPVRRRNLR